MTPEFRLVDTNILVRFFTGDPVDLAEKARALVARADAGKLTLEVLPIVVSETIYTLESFYEMPKDDVCAKILALLRCRGIRAHEEDRVIDALRRYRAHPVHFVDAYLAAASVELHHPVHSFDRDFRRFKDVDWKS